MTGDDATAGRRVTEGWMHTVWGQKPKRRHLEGWVLKVPLYYPSQGTECTIPPCHSTEKVEFENAAIQDIMLEIRMYCSRQRRPNPNMLRQPRQQNGPRPSFETQHAICETVCPSSRP